MNTSKTIAIAGCSGYIGTHMTQAALDLGLQVYGIDLQMQDAFLAQPNFTAIDTLDTFCDLNTDIHYLALQPNHRTPYLDRLIADDRFIFSEKPMARARDPHICDELVAKLSNSSAIMRYNFLLIYNPITEYIIQYLRSHKTVNISYMKSIFEKNRESRRNDRNKKFMEPIQYQESIHSLALMLVLRGETLSYDLTHFDSVFPKGLIAVGTSSPYDAPSADYDTIPDGRFYGTLTTSDFRMDVTTNFKRLDQQHFPTRQQKKVIISGVADGNPFTIEADYQRDQEMLSINNENISLPAFRPYEYIWQKVLLSDNPKAAHIITNEHLAQRAYQISALLWHASFTKKEIMIDANKTLSQTAQSYRDAFEADQLPFYQHNQKREWLERHLIDPVIDTAEILRMRLKRSSSHRK
jgi:predicted dehydrogenase